MDTKGIFLSICVCVALYVALCDNAVSRFLREHPGEERRVNGGAFPEFRRSLFSIALIFKPGFLKASASSRLRFQVQLCRGLLIGMPFYVAYTFALFDVG